MLIHDNDIKLRLPSSQKSFAAGEPVEGPFFSPTTFSSSIPVLGPISSEMAFMGIVSILGRATSYLQRGGLKGDSHFPWHANSKLASLRAELAAWYSSIPQQMYQNTDSLNQVDGPLPLFPIICYHLIHCLVFRDFLPVDYQRESSPTAMHRNWQGETTEACLSHANDIANALQIAQSTQGANIPPFIGY
jgi:hypothetical protein